MTIDGQVLTGADKSYLAGGGKLSDRCGQPGLVELLLGVGNKEETWLTVFRHLANRRVSRRHLTFRPILFYGVYPYYDHSLPLFGLIEINFFYRFQLLQSAFFNFWSY